MLYALKLILEIVRAWYVRGIVLVTVHDLLCLLISPHHHLASTYIVYGTAPLSDI